MRIENILQCVVEVGFDELSSTVVECPMFSIPLSRKLQALVTDDITGKCPSLGSQRRSECLRPIVHDICITTWRTGHTAIMFKILGAQNSFRYIKDW